MKFNNHSTHWEKFKKYNRGYSTIEKQVIRNIVMKPNTYRYTCRRKNFIEKIYLKYLFKALCARKARSLTHNKSKRKIFRKILSTNLKYHFIAYHYREILNNPTNVEELLRQMNKQSRVSLSLYKNIYPKFENSTLQKYHILQIVKAKMSKPRF